MVIIYVCIHGRISEQTANGVLLIKLRYMTSFTNEQAFAELYYTRRIIKDLLGVTPLCW